MSAGPQSNKGGWLIMGFGKRLHEKQGRHPHRLSYVVQKMRDLGCLLNVLMLLDLIIFSLEDAMKASSWYFLPKSVKIVSEFDYNTQSYSIPSIALKLGYSLQLTTTHIH